jgi:hypothetical protein
MNRLSFILTFLFLFSAISVFAQSGDVGLTASSISSDKIILNWQRIDQGNFTSEVQDCSGGTIVVLENVSSYVVKNLTANTEYGFRVKITTSSGAVHYTTCQNLKTIKKISFNQPQ